MVNIEDKTTEFWLFASSLPLTPVDWGRSMQENIIEILLSEEISPPVRKKDFMYNLTLRRYHATTDAVTKP